MPVIEQQEKRPVEYTAQYATRVESLSEAFVFIMQHETNVGADPQIIINPVWVCFDVDPDTGEHHTRREFEVSVSGMVEI